MDFFTQNKERKEAEKAFKKLTQNLQNNNNKHLKIVDPTILSKNFNDSLLLIINGVTVKGDEEKAQVDNAFFMEVACEEFSKGEYKIQLRTLQGNLVPQHEKFMELQQKTDQAVYAWKDSYPLVEGTEEGLLKFLEEFVKVINEEPNTSLSLKVEEKEQRTTKPLFKIKKHVKPEIIEKEIPRNRCVAKSPKSITVNPRPVDIVLLEPMVSQQLLEHIGWGNPRRENQVEQGGILIGEVYKHQKEHYWGLVKSIIPCKKSTGTPASLQMNHECWKEMLENYDNKDTDQKIIGWYHTHPNSLDVYMSNVDMHTQTKFFNNDWQFAIVLNPHRQIWKAFRGKEAKICSGYFLESDLETS